MIITRRQEAVQQQPGGAFKGREWGEEWGGKEEDETVLFDRTWRANIEQTVLVIMLF